MRMCVRGLGNNLLGLLKSKQSFSWLVQHDILLRSLDFRKRAGIYI